MTVTKRGQHRKFNDAVRGNEARRRSVEADLCALEAEKLRLGPEPVHDPLKHPFWIEETERIASRERRAYARLKAIMTKLGEHG